MAFGWNAKDGKENDASRQAYSGDPVVMKLVSLFLQIVDAHPHPSLLPLGEGAAIGHRWLGGWFSRAFSLGNIQRPNLDNFYPRLRTEFREISSLER